MGPRADGRPSRGFLQSITTGRYKYGRCFSDHQTLPSTWDELRNNCDLLLYDRVNDPDELENLAAEGSLEKHQELIMKLDKLLSRLICEEARGDRGPWPAQAAMI